MIAKRGEFEFCGCPQMTGAQQALGDWQCEFFYQEIQDAFLNVKNYNFSINAVQDLLDADVAILEASAITILGGIAGPGGALAGLGISLPGFLAASGDRIGITGTTHRQGYVNEMVPTNAVYDATGKYSLPVSMNTFYVWVEGPNDSTLTNGTAPIAAGKKFFSQGNTLALTGMPNQPVTSSVVTRGFRDIYAENLCLVMIDWGATVRQQRGSKQGIGGILYYPQVTLLFWAGGYNFATDITLLNPAGTMYGGINITNSVGVISNMSVATAGGVPIGQPSVFGQIQPNERYDALNWSIANNVITFSNITFDSFAGWNGITTGVFLEGQSLDFTVSADLKTLTATLPQNAPSGYVTFRCTTGDVYSTRTPI